MTILGIETSCDETAAAIVKGQDDTVTLHSQTVATSLDLHAKTGGIIPEQAAREQVRYMLPVLQETFEKAKITWKDIDAIAVTYGPGLIGSLLVGVETAKTLSYAKNKPLIPVNHMVGHIYANWIYDPKIHTTTNEDQNKRSTLNSQFSIPNLPAVVLVVSGGHTDLLLLEKHGSFQLLGGTRDDAAGEAYDKIGRLLGLPYPAGPIIEKLAKKGDPKRFRFPRPLMHDGSYEFSFSGLKTAVLREAQKQGETFDEQTTADLARGTQDAIIDVLTKKTIKAAIEHDVKAIILSGGVAANQTLCNAFIEKLRDTELLFHVPPRSLCTDNAAMIAAAAYFNQDVTPWQNITANPELYFD